MLKKTSAFKSLLILCVLSITFSIHANKSCDTVLKTGDYVVALPACEAELKNGTSHEVEIMLAMVEIHHELGNEELEAFYLAKIKNHPHYLENIEYQYQWNRRVGQKYYFLADYIQAQKHLHFGLSIATAQNNQTWLSKSFNDVGLVAFKLNDYANSLNYFKQSLALKQAHGDDFQIGTTLNNIALVHMDLEKYDQAINYYEQALSQYLSYTQQDGFDERVYKEIAHIYEDLTKAFTAINEVYKAKEYAKKIIDTFKLKNSPRSQARALMNLGKHHLSLKQYNSAKIFFDEAKSIHQQHQYEFDAEYYLAVTEIALHSNQKDEAIDLANKGLTLSELTSDHRLMSQYYILFSEIYEQSDPSKAIGYIKKQIISREKFLQEKYDEDLSNVQHEIEKQKIQHDLINQQLLSATQSSELQRLTNGVLIIIIVLIVISTAFLAFYLNKRRERLAMMQSIKHHEQQLFMMKNQLLTFNETDVHPSSQELKNTLKYRLVDTMIDALAIWEKTTNSDRIELAEKSKLWTISIDNGTLRTRSLDKYLDIDKIPDNPRWRNVVQTCHFILSQENLGAEDRKTMEFQLSELLDQIKQLSLATSN